MAASYHNDNFDSLLGAGSGRYFGSGYKSVRHVVLHVGMRASDSGHMVHGRGAVDYPVDWSTTPSGDLRTPHLSTIEVTTLAVMLLNRVCGLSSSLAWIRGAVIHAVDIRAGARSVEALNSVEITARLPLPLPNDRGRLASVAQIRVASFRLILELPPDATQLGQAADDGSSSEDLSPYVSGFRETTVSSELIEHDPAERAIRTRHHVTVGAAKGSGLDSLCWPQLTHIDNLVLFGQVAQVLVQVSDSLERGSIGNLWLRRTRIDRDPVALPAEFQTTARIASHTTLARGETELHSLELVYRSEHGSRAVAVFGYVVTPTVDWVAG